MAGEICDLDGNCGSYLVQRRRTDKPVLLLLIAWLFFISSSARAGGYNWDGGGATNNWSDIGNWLAIVPVSSVDTGINFTDSAQTIAKQDIAAPFLLNSISFNNASNFESKGNTLDFHTSTGGSAASIYQNGAGSMVIDNPTTLSDTLTILGNGSGQLTLAGQLSGSGGVIKNSSGTVTIATIFQSGSSNISFLAVNKGTVEVDSIALELSATGSTGFGGNSSLFVEGGAVFNVRTTAALRTVGTPQIHNDGQMNLFGAWTNSAASGGANEIRVGYAGGVSTLNLNQATLTTGGLRLGNSSFAGHGVLSCFLSTANVDTLTLDDPTGSIILTSSTFKVGSINEITPGATVTLNVQSRLEIGGNNSSSTFGGLLIGGVGDPKQPMVVKQGTGVLKLTGDSPNFAGRFVLNSGSLGIGSNTALGKASIDANGGALFASGADRTPGNSINTFSGKTLNLVSVAGDVHNLTLNQVISNGNVTVDAVGAAITLGGSAANTFSGLTSVRAGTLLLNKSDSIAAIGGDLAIGNASNPGAAGSAIVRLMHNEQTPNASDVAIYADGLFDLNGLTQHIAGLTMTGGEVRKGAGTLAVASVTTSASATPALISSNTVSLAGATVFSIARGTAAYDLDVQASVLGGSIVKQGAGILRLASQNSLSSPITLNAGTIAVANEPAVGIDAITLAGGTLVADGGNRTFGNQVIVNGMAAIGSSVDGTPRALTFNGPVTLNGGATLTVNNNAATTISNVLSGDGGLIKSGTGTLTLSNTANTFAGGLTLNGGILAPGSDGSLGAVSNLVTINAGQLQFSGNVTTARTFNLSNAATLAPAAGATLTYGHGASIHGGILGATGTHAFTEGSSLTGSTSALGSALTVDGEVTFNNVTLRGSATQSKGLLTANDTVVSSAGTLVLGAAMNTSGFENDGVLHVMAGGKVANTGIALVLGGGSRATIDSNGILATANGTAIEINGGLLVNNGTVIGVTNVHFNGLTTGTGKFGAVNVLENGRFAPGASATPGVFGAAAVPLGALSVAPTGAVEMEIGGATAGAGYDQINCNSATVLNGALHILTDNNFTPQILQQFKILSFPSRSGVFTSYTGQELPHGLAYAPVYSSADLKLIATIPGDATLDGKVDFADLVTVAQHYGATPATDNWWSSGDFNLDDKVDFSDLVAIAQNYNSSLSPAAAGAELSPAFAADWNRALEQSSVPEPAMGGMLVVALAWVARRGRRRSK